jgi:hypothetical protein
MREDKRIWAVKELLLDYVKSPSLRHIRDPYSLSRLAQEIVKRVDRGNSVWKKWDGQREVLLKSVLGCWIPTKDLQGFLNSMPGPPLTTTDERSMTDRTHAVEELLRDMDRGKGHAADSCHDLGGRWGRWIVG